MKRFMFAIALIACLVLTAAAVYGAPAEITLGGQKLLGTNVGDTNMGKAQAVGSKLTITGAGWDVWDTADACYFVYKEVTGDFEATLKVDLVSDANSWSKLGLMVRTGIEAGAVNAFLTATNQNGIEFQWRPEADGGSQYVPGDAWENGVAPAYLKIVRKADEVKAYSSLDGKAWTVFETPEPVMVPGKALLGIAHTSHDAAETGAAGECSDFTIK